MTTIDNIMALHDEAAEKRHINGAPVYNAVAAHAREALRTAVTEALAAQPVREPLNKSEWPKHPSAYVNDEYIGYSKSDLTSYAMQVLQAHGIGGDK